MVRAFKTIDPGKDKNNLVTIAKPHDLSDTEINVIAYLQDRETMEITAATTL